MKRFLSRLLASQQDANAAAQNRTVPIATAALLLQVARADYEFTAEEQAEIAASLERFFHLTREEVADIMQISEAELKERIDIYFFTSQLNQVLNPAQRLQVIEMAWRVVYADRSLSGHEDQLIHRLASLLRLDHSQLIDAKLRVKGDIFPKER